ncbi:MAG: hypothetical protein WD423_06765 [Rhodothermales bacterium]
MMTWFAVGIALWITLLLLCWVWLDCSIDEEESERSNVRRSSDRHPARREAFHRPGRDTTITEDK